MLNSLLNLQFSLPRTVLALIALGALASFDLIGRMRHREMHVLFATVLGTLLAIGLIAFTETLLSPALQGNASMMAFGMVLIVILWRLLFGPWEAQTKAVVLGVFVFWVGLHMLLSEQPEERMAHALAIGTAAIPAVIWCLLFLSYHMERISVVLLMFFAGMLATAPILFYDALVRHGAELDFFILKIIPENFSSTAQSFVASQFPHMETLKGTIITLFLSFILVGVLEESAKYWVLHKNSKSLFTSIDDVMQMAIIVAIGFAFAENITNSGYFLGFVKEYLLTPGHVNWSDFIGNVVGRSILTSMVHIVSTGVLGYFLALALFAPALIDENKTNGKKYPIVEWIHSLLGWQRKDVLHMEMIACGLVLATLLHAFSNFLVTLPDVLPGHPHTVGDLLHSSEGSPLHYIALLLFPALLYVVGGFWLLTNLFMQGENTKERGRYVAADTFVKIGETV